MEDPYLETKTFSNAKLKELQCHKTRVKQPLLGARTTANFMPIRLTVVGIFCLITMGT